MNDIGIFRVPGMLPVLLTLPASGGPEQRVAEHLERDKALYEEGDPVKTRPEQESPLHIDSADAEAPYLLARLERQQ